MRTIKFRAWNVDDGIMLYSDFNAMGFYSKENPNEIAENTETVFMYHDYTGDKDFALMQYTGLKDKNDVEVYEGDIVQCEIYGIAEIGLVKYSDNLAAFFLTEMGRSDTELWGCSKKVIIGKIYENLELLEVPNE